MITKIDEMGDICSRLSVSVWLVNAGRQRGGGDVAKGGEMWAKNAVPIACRHADDGAS